MVGVQLIQISGVIFIFIMLYMTYLFYKKDHYSKTATVVWILIWACAIILLVFQRSVGTVIDSLNFARTTDLYLTLGLAFVLASTFYNYVKLEKQDRRLEEFVRKIAIQRAKVPKKRK